jgi:hypothetical protein
VDNPQAFPPSITVNLRSRSGGVSVGRAGATASAASKLLQAPFRHAQRLRWRRTEGFVSAGEIVVRDVERDRA